MAAVRMLREIIQVKRALAKRSFQPNATATDWSYTAL